MTMCRIHVRHHKLLARAGIGDTIATSGFAELQLYADVFMRGKVSQEIESIHTCSTLLGTMKPNGTHSQLAVGAAKRRLVSCT